MPSILAGRASGPWLDTGQFFRKAPARASRPRSGGWKSAFRKAGRMGTPFSQPGFRELHEGWDLQKRRPSEFEARGIAASIPAWLSELELRRVPISVSRTQVELGMSRIGIIKERRIGLLAFVELQWLSAIELKAGALHFHSVASSSFPAMPRQFIPAMAACHSVSFPLLPLLAFPIRQPLFRNWP